MLAWNEILDKLKKLAYIILKKRKYEVVLQFSKILNQIQFLKKLFYVV